MEYFGEIEDPRIERCQRHKLLDIIAIAICAVICGADNWSHIGLFGQGKEGWLQSSLELPNGIPSHDTPAFAGAGSLAVCSPSWTQRSSSDASWNGPRGWPS